MCVNLDMPSNVVVSGCLGRRDLSLNVMESTTQLPSRTPFLFEESKTGEEEKEEEEEEEEEEEVIINAGETKTSAESPLIMKEEIPKMLGVPVNQIVSSYIIFLCSKNHDAEMKRKLKRLHPIKQSCDHSYLCCLL